MTKRSAALAILVAGVFCLGGISIQAVDFEDVYITGGIAHWPEFGATPSRFSFQFPATSYERSSISDSSSQTSLKVGAGYSIDESWSVEAVAIVGMEHETSVPSLFGRVYTELPVFFDDSLGDDFEIGFDVGVTRKLKASILRINPAYTIPVQGDFSLFGKAGIAFIERDFKVSIHTEYELEDELRQGIDIVFTTSLQVVSESDSMTNLFASAGIRWSPANERFAVSISYSNYFDTPGDVTHSLELDYQWKF